ncbi:MAG: TRAM domain-containing protein [Luteolibacter sp.]
MTTGRTTQNKIVIFDGDPDRLIGQLLGIQIEQSTGFTLFGTACLEG